MRTLTPKTNNGFAPEKIRERFDKYKVIDILRTISDTTGVSELEIVSGTRAPRVYKARVQVYAALRERGWSYPDIGALFDRDHSAIHSALNKKSREGCKALDIE
jgi:chromosomal replication initiation ATPase DnaA